MRVLFIEAKYSKRIGIKQEEADKLPERIGIVSTVQFACQLDSIRNILKKYSKKAVIGKGRQKYKGQILGCDVSAAEKIKKDVDAFLYIGDGRFHPIEVKLKTGKDVYTLNPYDSENKILKLSEDEIIKIKKKINGSYLKFLNSKDIGVLISTKKGQHYDITKIRNALDKYKDKNYYYLLFDTLNANELDNFNFIGCFINTACPRLAEDIEKPVINISDIVELQRLD